MITLGRAPIVFLSTVVLLAVVLTVRAQTPIVTPPSIDVPGDPAKTAGVAVAPAKRLAADNAHTAWKAEADNAEFSPGLTYVQGQPVLMLITPSNENAAKQARRRQALVSACAHLLDDAAFDETVLCVVTIDPANPRSQTVRNQTVRRQNYQQALKKAAKTADVKSAVRQAKEDAAVLRKICTELKID